jgi:voltage-gated potassium channel
MTSETWERRTDWPMTALAVVFLAAYAWPILDADIGSGVAATLGGVSAAIWVVFGFDYVARVWLAERRLSYVRRHWFDIPLLVLPMLRPLRALRAVVAVQRFGRQAAMSVRGSALLFVAAGVPVVLFVACVAMLDAERTDPDANITTFGDAIWWACTTVTTVGYGDRYPVTTEGRLVAVALMLAGIALVGVVTASLASWFVEKLSDVQEAEQRTQTDLDLLRAEIRALREELRDGGRSVRPDRP